ncbi:hypothetical protein Gohar_027037 [Gossypium harknessii]|uniref:RNase H type-1 domain-containing protein n=1 Tax=Gossypium harknessii TaxID=34285 RepID=A0A7J9HTI7_9ROSI|nr:hypothetical protein [Gossypium harknessii]
MVAQNDKGEVLVSKSTLNMEVASPFAMEACACAQAVRLGLAMGVKKIETEGDTLTIITKCQSTAIEKLKIGAYIRDIQHNKSGFQSIWFKYIQRSANKTTHKIASKSLRR